MLSSQSVGRMRVVRLAEIDIRIRRRAGQRLIDAYAAEGDLLAALRMRDAVERPSARVYLLPAAAVERVTGSGRS